MTFAAGGLGLRIQEGKGQGKEHILRTRRENNQVSCGTSLHLAHARNTHSYCNLLPQMLNSIHTGL